jgi:hypothetical protein
VVADEQLAGRQRAVGDMGKVRLASQPGSRTGARSAQAASRSATTRAWGLPLVDLGFGHRAGRDRPPASRFCAESRAARLSRRLLASRGFKDLRRPDTRFAVDLPCPHRHT